MAKAPRRWRGLRLLFVLSALVAGAAAFFLLGGSDDETRAPVEDKTAVVPIDAAPVKEEPIDAPDSTREDIVALSRYGFLTLKASAKTTIYIDGKYIGETPMTRLPLSPGPKKIKAIGPKGKTKLINTTILGGQDTDEGTITW